MKFNGMNDMWRPNNPGNEFTCIGNVGEKKFLCDTVNTETTADIYWNKTNYMTSVGKSSWSPLPFNSFFVRITLKRIQPFMNTVHFN